VDANPSSISDPSGRFWLLNKTQPSIKALPG
jgi:hypothetical protein